MTTVFTRQTTATGASNQNAPLTNAQVDQNFIDLNANKLELGQTFSAGIANAIPYLNTSKVLSSGTGLTFDGTTLSAGSTTAAFIVSKATAGNQAFVSAAGNGAVLGTSSFDMIQDSAGIAYLYQRANQPLIIGTNNTEKMRLDASGNLGLGTSSPLSALGFGEAASAAGVTFQSTNTTFNSGKVAVIKASIAGSGNGSLLFETYQGGSGGAERMRLDASGNLGLGVTPSGWVGINAFQFGPLGAVSSSTSAGTVLSNNAYAISAGWAAKYITTGTAAFYEQFGGAHYWLTAPFGTADAAISFTQTMTLDANGRLGIGETSPVTRIHAKGARGVDAEIRATSTGTGTTDRATIRLFSSVSTSGGGMVATNGSDTVYPQNSLLLYTFDNQPLVFGTNNSERARIDASGNLNIANLTASKAVFTNASKNLTSTGTLGIDQGGTGATTAGAALTALGAQAALVSGTNIKTINGTSVLGSGDIAITSGVSSVAGNTGAVTASQLLTAINTVDGAASGLDADLLDGQHGSYYQPLLVSATNIKTVNGTSILGSGDLTIATGSPDNIVELGAANSDIDLSAGLYFTKTVSGNTTFVITNVPTNKVVVFTIEIAHTSGTITWPASVKWPYSNYLTPLTTNRTHLFSFLTDNGGTTWIGSVLPDYIV